MTHTNRRATVAYHNDGNGGKAISINLSLIQFAVGMILQLTAVCSLGWAVATFVGRAQVREWWRSEGAPAVHQMLVDEIVAADAKQDRQLVDQIDNRMERLRETVSEINTQAATNRSILERIEDDVRELRRIQARTDP